MIDVVVLRNFHYGRNHYYGVYVDGTLYDSFNSSKPLTHSEAADVARGYEEALRAYG